MNNNNSDSQQNSPNSEGGEGGPNDPCKMFIGGLSWQTTADSLREYFGKFGEVTECMVMRDPATKRARGFGFITFADASSVDKVLAQQVHELDGKKIDPKVAFPKRAQPKMVTRTKKIFVGGLSASSTVEDMKTYFTQFGTIEEAMLMFDKSTNRHRGFGFISFDNEDVVEKVCEIHFHEINGKMVECKKAQPKEVMLPVQLAKGRAAGRNLYGLPEHLLANYAAAYLPRLGYSPTGLYYPTNLYGYLFAPGDKLYPDIGITAPALTVAGSRADFARSVLNGYQAGYISPTSPVGSRGFGAAGASPQGLDVYGGGPGDVGSFMPAASPQPLPPLHVKATPQLIAAYNGYH